MPPARGSAPGLITFTSDFGDGWYSGAMKGAALQVNPRAVVIDLTHGISAMNVLEGAFALAAGCDAFPDGAVHVAVIDPGVGTSRRGVVVETERFRFVGPDNGLLSLAAPPSRIERAFVLENARFFRTAPSATFHGRDIFAPVAAHLTLGVDAAEMGPPARAIEPLGLPEVIQDGEGWTGEILLADAFGNCVTNMPEAVVRMLPQGEVWLDDRRIGPLSETYGAVPRGEALALVGSHGYLEIAVHGGSALERLGAVIGAKVRLK
jgi:S-adenosylmethionine hydrolase